MSVFRLEERLGGDPVGDAVELLLEALVAGEHDGLAAGGRLGLRVGAREQEPLAVDGVDQRVEVERLLRALGDDEPHLQLAGALALADHEVAQVARTGLAIERGDAVLARPRDHLPARGVHALGGEDEVVDVDDAPPLAGRVEAAGDAGLRRVVRVVGRERELDLVAVAPLLDRPARCRASAAPRTGRGAPSRRAPARPSR
ncbi:MAG: hypothetical protein PGN13_13280 [Patulibacter minatonensis]